MSKDTTKRTLYRADLAISPPWSHTTPVYAFMKPVLNREHWRGQERGPGLPYEDEPPHLAIESGCLQAARRALEIAAPSDLKFSGVSIMVR